MRTVILSLTEKEYTLLEALQQTFRTQWNYDMPPESIAEVILGTAIEDRHALFTQNPPATELPAWLKGEGK